ncbi:ATP-binding protein [Winogradskyella tangerina]|uniref:ATP-binding protein n=1 Tax=Winogradskyella tangerina TaxID=2023240 RepID=UPI000DBE5147|nr:ATP-binding protein [Winogradskyella tangerina]
MKYYLFLWFSLISIISFSQEIYNIDTTYPVHNLMTHLKIVEDGENTLSEERILKDSTIVFLDRSQFAKFLKPNTTYWGKIYISSKNDLKNWTLHLEDRFIGPPAWTKSNGTVDIFAYDDSGLIFHKKSGVEYNRSERDVKANWVLNQIGLDEIPTNKPTILIIKVRGNQLGYPAYFNLTVRSPEQPFYHQIFQFNNSFNLFMLGVTFIIFLYHLLLFIYSKEKVFLWFSVWLFFCLITHAMTVGIIIGSFTNFRFPFYMIMTNAIFFSFWFFGRSFIESKKKYPILDRCILGISYFLILEIIFTILYVVIFNSKPIYLDIGIHFVVLNIYCVVSLVISILLTIKKDKFAKYFGFGSIIASSFLILGTLWSLGIISPIRNFVDPYATGIFLQIVIYSFGIAYRQQQLSIKAQEEKLKAQATKAEIARVKDLDKIKTRFFANISHEFRTPLALISGPINRIKNRSSDSNNYILDQKHFEIINNNTKRLQNLVDQLLELSKIESGNVYLSLKQGGIIQLIRSLVFSFESLAERQNISLNTSFPQEIDFAFYDKDKLEKIISNLLSNAFKYTSDNGSVTVIVDHDENYISIQITDSGKGIDSNEVKRIFERFYRVEGNEEKGSGIGLALTKELIELQKGNISVDSTKGVGTTFKVRLPINLNFLPQELSIISKKEEKSEKTEDLDNNLSTPINNDPQNSNSNPIDSDTASVLLVEDNQDLQSYISDIFNETYSVLLAKDGEQGERMAFEHIPDIIVSDIMMPKKDGFQLCHSIKNNPKTSHIPIIMLTAKAGHQNKIEGLTQGADAYITKPFDENEMLLLMRNLINSRKKLWDHFKALDMLLVDDIEVSSIDDRFLQEVFKTIKENIDNENFGVEDIANKVGFSRSQLHRKLKALSNKSANQLITEIRLNEAYRLLKLKTGTVSEIAYSVGYSNLSYFTKSFKDKFGQLPSKVE